MEDGRKDIGEERMVEGRRTVRRKEGRKEGLCI
jgi:hypothetical protein